MSRTFDLESVSAFAQRPKVSLFAPFRKMIETVGIWLKRSQAREDLLDFLAKDYRAAADIGINRNDALEWAHRPFWRD
jgi:uncharacterized protein YjiS (DUF1127 family)